MTASQPIIDDDVARVTPGVVDTAIGDRIVVIHPADDTVHVLDGTAALVWKSLTTSRTVGELVSVLASDPTSRSGVTADDIRTTLARFVHAEIAMVGPPSFVLGPPDFTPERQISAVDDPARDSVVDHRAQRVTRPAHPLLVRLLDNTRWSAVIGPVRAGSADVVVRTNNPGVGDAIGELLAGLPSAPEGRWPGPDEASNPSLAPEDGETGEPTPRPPVFTNTEFRPGVFRATDPRAITREPSRARIPDPRVPYDPRAEREPEIDPDNRPTTLSALHTDKDGPRRFRLFIDGTEAWHGDSAESLIAMIATELDQLCITHTTDHILFRAGGVERDGEVILIAGDEGAGKSTLTAALTRRGFRYLTDEIAAVDPTSLEVTPYPRAILLDHDSAQMIGVDTEPETGSTSPNANSTKHPIPVDMIGDASQGGTLALLVLLDDPASPALSEYSNAYGELMSCIPGASDTDASIDHPSNDRLGRLITLLGTVFRQSFADPRTLHALVNLDRRVRIIDLERTSIDEACSAVEGAFGNVVAVDGRGTPT